MGTIGAVGAALTLILVALMCASVRKLHKKLDFHIGEELDRTRHANSEFGHIFEGLRRIEKLVKDKPQLLASSPYRESAGTPPELPAKRAVWCPGEVCPYCLAESHEMAKTREDGSVYEVQSIRVIRGATDNVPEAKWMCFDCQSSWVCKPQFVVAYEEEEEEQQYISRPPPPSPSNGPEALPE